MCVCTRVSSMPPDDEGTAPDVDVSIVQQPTPEPVAPEPVAPDIADALDDAAADEAQQSEIAVLTARVIEQSEHLGRLSGLLEGLETRYAPSGDYVTRSEMESRLAAHDDVDESAVVVEPPEPEPLPEGLETDDAGDGMPMQSGPARLKFRW